MSAASVAVSIAVTVVVAAFGIGSTALGRSPSVRRDALAPVDHSVPLELTPENVARVLDEFASGQRITVTFTIRVTREALERVRPGPAAFITWAKQLERAAATPVRAS